MKRCFIHRRVVPQPHSGTDGSTLRRRVPGDCYCLDCVSPIPYWWNHGQLTPATKGETGPKEKTT